MQYISWKPIFRRRVWKSRHWPLRREMIPVHTLPNIFLSIFISILFSFLLLFHRNFTAVLSENFAQSKYKSITFCHLLGVILKWEAHESQCTIYYGHMLLQSAQCSFRIN